MRELSPVDIDMIRHLVTGTAPPPAAGDVDWELIVSSCGHHRLIPLLHEGARQSPVELPRAVETQLERAFHVELAKAVVRLHHVDAIDSLAKRSGRDACLLKGAAFAGSLYANPASRPMADIDVLVRPEQLDAWASDVDALGFSHHDTSDHATSFKNHHTGVFLELHRSLTSCNGYLGLETDTLFDRSRPSSGALRALTLEDHLTHVCLHASFQNGFRQAAINAVDAHRLVSHPEFDRSRFLEQCLTPRLAPWVFGGLHLSNSVFPNEALETLGRALRASVPGRIVRHLDERPAASGLSLNGNDATRPPYRRLLWAGDISSTLSLLIEVLRPRGPASTLTVSAWVDRATQLVWNHCLKVIPLVLMKQAYAYLRPTPASLGEVRDV